MTPITDMVRRLIAAGCDPAEAAAVVAETYALDRAPVGGSDERMQRIREKDRNRKRNARGNSMESMESMDYANKDAAQSLQREVTKKEDTKKEKEESKKETKKEVAASYRGTILPSDWRPTEKHFDEGLALGLLTYQVEEAARDMRLWAEANRNRAIARKADWNLTFLGWMRRNHKKPIEAAVPVPNPEIARKTEEYRAQLAAAKEKRNAQGQEPQLV